MPPERYIKTRRHLRALQSLHKFRKHDSLVKLFNYNSADRLQAEEIRTFERYLSTEPLPAVQTTGKTNTVSHQWSLIRLVIVFWLLFGSYPTINNDFTWWENWFETGALPIPSGGFFLCSNLRRTVIRSFTSFYEHLRRYFMSCTLSPHSFDTTASTFRRAVAVANFNSCSTSPRRSSCAVVVDGIKDPVLDRLFKFFVFFANGDEYRDGFRPFRICFAGCVCNNRTWKDAFGGMATNRIDEFSINLPSSSRGGGITGEIQSFTEHDETSSDERNACSELDVDSESRKYGTSIRLGWLGKATEDVETEVKIEHR